MRIKNIALIQAAVLAAMTPVMSNVQTVSADDYSIELTIEETEIPINYIESNRIVYVPISVNNNPGIDSLSFIIQRDNRITERITARQYDDFPFHGGVNTMYARDNIYAGVIAGFLHDAYYDYNGRYCYIEVTLPENYQIGDYYSLSFCTDDFSDLMQVQFEKDQQVYGKEFFKLNNGGIRIIDEVNYGVTPDNQVQPSTEASVNNDKGSQNQHDNSQEVQNQNNNNNSNNDNTHSDSNSSESSNTKGSVTTTVTSTAATGTTTVSSVAKTSAPKNVSKTTVTKISTEKSTTKQPVTETAQTDTVATVAQTKKSRNYTTIVAAAVSALVLLAIGTVTVIIKKKKK